ncbi:MAG: glucokinase [candidate division Zixibacteria bacterium]|nr:glucokinase [candidate division Zixibacteria bacterium]
MSEKLAGYVSGSSVELVRVGRDGDRLLLLDQQRYAAREFSSFDAILQLYLKRSGTTFDTACIGVAGPVIGGEVKPTNLPWHIASMKIEEQFCFRQVRLVNDIVATAHGLPHLTLDKFYTINQGVQVPCGTIGLIAAGSGLGEALIHDDCSRKIQYASEGGHADFAPGNQLEMELWQYLYSELGHVEVEDVVSLRGLERIYEFLIDMQGEERGDWYENAKDRPAAVTEKALSGSDETAIHALDVFIDCYASEAANLALTGMTLGGIFVGGRIAPQIITAMDQGRFMQRFVKKGKMELLLERMPVGIIIEEKTALMGAAALALTL